MSIKSKIRQKSIKNTKKTNKHKRKSVEQILYLTHITKLSNIENILKSEKILTDYERFLHKTSYEGLLNATIEYKKDKKDNSYKMDMYQFPGVYLGFITEYHINKEIDYLGGDVIFVFGKEILMQKNYHANIIDSNGRIAENLTYFPHNINEIPNTKDVVKYYENKYGGYPGNEIVFHDGISTKLITEIWVKNKDIQDKLVDILTKINLTEYIDKISIVSTFQNKQINIQDNKLIYLDKSLPFFTYYMDNGTTGFYETYYPYKNKTKSSKTFLEKIIRIAKIQDEIINIDREEVIKKFNNKRINKMDIPHYYFFNRNKQDFKKLDKYFYTK